MDESTKTRQKSPTDLRTQLMYGVAFAIVCTGAGMLASSSWWEVLLFGTCIGFVAGFLFGPVLLQQILWRWLP